MLIKPFPNVENIIAIAMPFVGYADLITANMYVLGKGPVTLIDTGPKLPGALEYIQSRLRLRGLDFKDVERIIITHGHLDHFGLATRIRQLAGRPVECYIHTEDKWRASSDFFREGLWSEEIEKFMATVDMPRKEIAKMRKRFSAFKKLSDPLDELSTIEDGEEFDGDGYHLKVIHTPGHTSGTICLYESREKILFSGDHIIKHITPNPLLEIMRDRLRNPEYQSLKAYLNSLDKLKGLSVRFVFPGHGEYIEDLQGIIASYIDHHRERMDLVWNVLKKKPRPLFHLIDDIFPFVPEDDIFLAISEIMVHLEILINEGRARLSDSGPPAIYRAIED